MSSQTSRLSRLRNAAGLAALLLATSGCALFDRNGPQQIEVHAMLGQREVAGVGCMLANDSGRWSVVAPGRVTVQRSMAPLSVDCLRHGSGSRDEQAAAPAELARLDAHLLIGARGGQAYPATLNVVLEGSVAAGPVPEASTPIF